MTLTEGGSSAMLSSTVRSKNWTGTTRYTIVRECLECFRNNVPIRGLVMESSSYRVILEVYNGARFVLEDKRSRGSVRHIVNVVALEGEVAGLYCDGFTLPKMISDRVVNISNLLVKCGICG